jgi:hypothetical protein
MTDLDEWDKLHGKRIEGYALEKWGCPDWTDRQAYPVTAEDLEEWEWRWEFLRRGEYRGAWALLQGSRNPQSMWFPMKMLFEMFDLYGLEDPRTKPSSNPFKNFTSPGMYYFPEDEFMDYYKEFPSDDRFSKLVEDLKGGQLLTNNPESCTSRFAIFDLSRPLQAQIDVTTKALKQAHIEWEERHRKVAAPHLYGSARKNWVRHLRVLDAHDQGASTREIWTVIKTSELMSEKNCTEPDSEEFETLLDVEVYAASKTKIVAPTVNSWIESARSTAFTVARHLVSE